VSPRQAQHQQQQGNPHQYVQINVQGIKYVTLTQEGVRCHVSASQVRVVTQKLGYVKKSTVIRVALILRYVTHLARSVDCHLI
jgi:hypothetical protein